MCGRERTCGDEFVCVAAKGFSAVAPPLGRCESAEGPHATPGCFAKRGCKLLKTKGSSAKKRDKRFQEAATF